MRILAFLSVIWVALLPTIAIAHDPIQSSEANDAFESEFERSIEALADLGAFENLVLPGFGARLSTQEVDDLVSGLAEAGITRPTVSYFGVGDSSVKYDVILQPGHFMRERCCGNATGSNGLFDRNATPSDTSDDQVIYEQDYVAVMTLRVAENLSQLGHNVLVVPADGFSERLDTKIFLAFHLDGSTDLCSLSSSLGYNDDTDLLGAHAVGLALSGALGVDYPDFKSDNYTTGLSRYYAFSSMRTSIFEAVVEIAELSCSEQAELVLFSTEDLITNFTVMLDAMLRLETN